MIRGGIRLVTALVGVMAIGLPVAAQSDREPPQIIKQVMEASKKLRYKGQRRVQMRFGPDLVQHTEYILKDRLKTRIWFPDEGSFRGQIIVENESERRHYFPDRNQIEIMPARREEYAGRLGRFGKQGRPEPDYRIEDGGQIAGFATKKIDLMGGDKVFMSMWVDPKTGLVLKRVVYNKQNQAMATSEFTQVDLNPKFKSSDFELRISGAKLVTPRDRLGELIQRGGFQSVSLPPKDPFKLESARIQRIDNVPTLVQVYVKKDGRISLFQIKAALDPDRLKQYSRGEKLGTYTWQKGGASFVLLGEMAEAKLREIAQRLLD